MSEYTGVPAEAINQVWHLVEPMVERGLKKINDHRWEPADIHDALLQRDMQLWLAAENGEVSTIVITRLVRYPRVLECELFLWVGRRTDDWRDQLAMIEDWARAQGCHYMASLSRPGSARVIGYEKGLIQTHRRL